MVFHCLIRLRYWDGREINFTVLFDGFQPSTSTYLMDIGATTSLRCYEAPDWLWEARDGQRTKGKNDQSETLVTAGGLCRFAVSMGEECSGLQDLGKEGA
jgi:hypothetical protein